MNEPVSIADYARSRGLSRSAVLRWIREKSAPVAAPGSNGPGQITLVDADALDSWRGLNDGARKLILEQVAAGLLDTLVRDGPENCPLHRSVGIERRQAAAMLAFAFERAARRVMGRDLEELPQSNVQIRTIVQNC